MENIGVRKFDIDVDLSIIQKIYDVTKIEQSANRSNKGGYQGQRHNLESFSWMMPILNQIHEHINFEYVTYWFNINGPGHYNALHDHGYFGDKLCGCLYLQTPEGSGDIRFVSKKSELIIQPKVGKFILFPDNLKHEVFRNLSDDDRISIAFNFWKM